MRVTWQFHKSGNMRSEIFKLLLYLPVATELEVSVIDIDPILYHFVLTTQCRLKLDFELTSSFIEHYSSIISDNV